MPAPLMIDLEEFSRSVPSRDNVRTAPADEWIRTVRAIASIRVVHLSASARSPTTTFIDPPHAVDGFELTGTSCGSPLMVLRTLSTAPRLLQLVLDDARAARNLDPLLASAAVAMFPGLAANARSVLAAFGYAAAADSAWHAVIMPLSPCAASNRPSRRGEIDLSSAAEGSFALRAQDDARVSSAAEGSFALRAQDDGRVSSAAEGSFASLRMTCGAQRRKRRQFARGDSWQWPTRPMASFGSIASPPIVSA
jgi:hypothetical protein